MNVAPLAGHGESRARQSLHALVQSVAQLSSMTSASSAGAVLQPCIGTIRASADLSDAIRASADVRGVRTAR